MVVKNLLTILNELLDDDLSVKSLVNNQVQRLAGYLECLKLTTEKDKKVVTEIVRNLLILGEKKATKDKAWPLKITGALTRKLTREYVNDILIAEILEVGNKSDLAQQLLTACKGNLQRSVLDKPIPPSSWSRQVPKKSGVYGDVWDILADFLTSPILQVFDYQAIQAMRNEMEFAIRSVVIDLKMETIKKGSPHTLRLTKTQDAFHRELGKWEKDVALLKKVELF